MTVRGIAALALALMICGCANQTASVNGCPAPVHYSAATLAQIQKALEALPANNILHRTMTDYEYERDDLRFCTCK